MILDKITKAETQRILRAHYLGPFGERQPVVLALAEAPEHWALAAFCNPNNAGFTRALPGCLELARLWQSEERRTRVLEFGHLSRFVLATFDWIKSHRPHTPCVFTYSDPAQGHHGGVYQAARFKRLGASTVTDEWIDQLDQRVTARSLYRELGTKDHAPAEALGFKRLRKVPKVCYVYPLTVSM